MSDEIAQVIDLEYKGAYYLLKGTKAMIAAMVSAIKALGEWNHKKWLDKPGSCSWQKIQEVSEGMAPILEFPKEMFVETIDITHDPDIKGKGMISPFEYYCRKNNLRYCVMPDLNPNDDYIPVAVPAQDFGIHDEQIKAFMRRRIEREEAQDKEYDKKLDETKSRLDNAETDKEKEELKEQIEALEEAKSQNSGLLSESKEKMEHGNRLDFTEYLQQAEGTELLNDPERAMEMAQSCGMVRECKVDECLKPVRDKALIPESGTLLYSQKAGEGQMLTIKRNFELDDKGLVYSLYEISDPLSGRALKTVSDKGVSGDALDKMLNEILAAAGMLRDQPVTVHKSEDDLKEYVRISDKNFTTAREEGGQDISEEAKAVIEEARKDAQQRQGYMRSFYKTLEVSTERVMSDEERKLSLELDGGLVEGITLIGMDDEKARVSICSDAEYKYKGADGRTRTISGEDIMKSLEGKGKEQSPERTAAKPAKRG